VKYKVTSEGVENIPDPENPYGVGVSVQVFRVSVEEGELTRLLANYDPNSGTSPGVADARPVLRAILDAAIAAGV
jgi:hypothetical protein